MSCNDLGDRDRVRVTQRSPPDFCTALERWSGRPWGGRSSKNAGVSRVLGRVEMRLSRDARERHEWLGSEDAAKLRRWTPRTGHECLVSPGGRHESRST